MFCIQSLHNNIRIYTPSNAAPATAQPPTASNQPATSQRSKATSEVLYEYIFYSEGEKVSERESRSVWKENFNIINILCCIFIFPFRMNKIEFFGKFVRILAAFSNIFLYKYMYNYEFNNVLAGWCVAGGCEYGVTVGQQDNIT